MASKYRVRYIFRPLVQFIAKGCARIHMTPNLASCVMLTLAVLAALSLLYPALPWVFGILVFFTGVFDGVDGAIARQTNQGTKRGGLLDSTLDRISEIVIWIGVFLWWGEADAILGLPVFLWVFVVLLGSLMTSYARARVEIEGATDLDVGLMARSERLFTLVIFALINLIAWGIVVLAVTTNLTAGFRVLKYRQRIEQLPTAPDRAREEPEEASEDE